MKKNNMLLGAVAFVALSLAARAQTARQEIDRNPLLSASNYTAYYADSLEMHSTPAPKGYKPVYMSHYARHGSRWLIGSGEYDNPFKTLQVAHQAGKLTAAGERVWTIVERLHNEQHGRRGELTPKGARQHRGIARRMYERFPEIFGRSISIDARSTPVVRCILSMMAECNELTALNPRLQFVLDASNHDLYYMNGGYSELTHKRNHTPAVSQAERALTAERLKPERLMGVLFNDTAYVRREVKAGRLMGQLFSLAANMQSHDYGADMQLLGLFTPEERYNQWVCDNFSWYNSLGPSPLVDGLMPGMEGKLLKNIVGTADSMLLQKGPGATLRFGHEVCVLPLACLMELGECGYRSTNPDSVAAHWRNYKIFPMACNIQLVFYRSKKASDPLLVKALLNEREVALPATPYDYPYYRWDDVRSHWLATLQHIDRAVDRLRAEQKKD